MEGDNTKNSIDSNRFGQVFSERSSFRRVGSNGFNRRDGEMCGFSIDSNSLPSSSHESYYSRYVQIGGYPRLFCLL